MENLFNITQIALDGTGAHFGLVDLIRKEQDTRLQYAAMQSTISNVLAIPEDQRDPASISKLMVKLNALKAAQAALRDEIDSRFPRYSEFTAPQPATIAAAQKVLHPGEALISIYSSESRTYVWAFDQGGNTQFSTVNIGREKTGQMTAQLRKALRIGILLSVLVIHFSIANRSPWQRKRMACESHLITVKTDADWVVLSACSTAAAGGTGAEVVFGLGRAFF